MPKQACLLKTVLSPSFLLATLVVIAAWGPLSSSGSADISSIRNQAVVECDDSDGQHWQVFSNVSLLFSGSFPDVPPDHWAYTEIMACAAAGIVRGYPDGLYLPGVSVTRSQMAVYTGRALARSDTNPPAVPAVPTFPDVPNTGYGEDGTEPYWAFEDIEYVVDKGVVEGYPDGSYQPHWQVTRGQMAAFIGRAMGWVSIDDDMDTAPQLFPDVPAGYWSGTAIEACVVHDVVQGYPEGYYRPTVTVTRDQMAVYVARAFRLMQ